ncbi:MAG: isoleucine--tRNA ligase [Sphingobacteriaceae bacterium]|nr:isoleucine--tRNA ligase [Sphingobacteriaceae bacterium]
MANTYPEYKQLDLTAVNRDIAAWWKKEGIFERSISEREGAPAFVFYEGPPSANGIPGIHHVMARAIKDIFCRFQTMQGKQVKRKSGWDTHGLPIELQVEKKLGITKDDIGKKISVEEYNRLCRQDVMEFTGLWEELTEQMGYWVDLKDPYVTYKNEYIETIWALLKRLHEKDLLYKGYTIQPFSPAAGTGLSSHELNQPGTYREVKDTSAVAQFKAEESSKFKVQSLVGAEIDTDLFFLAWTTTPWTLPSNTALAVGEKIDYVLVRTFNPYTHLPVTLILAEALMGKYFRPEQAELPLEGYEAGQKQVPYRVLGKFKGAALDGLRYEQLLPYAQPEDGDAFRVVLGDFVTTEDGTGMVHIAPSFGADDFRVAKQNGIGSLTLVDRRGRFVDAVNDATFPLAGMFVKEAYLSEEEKAEVLALQQDKLKAIIPNLSKYLSVDELITLKLKLENRAFKIEKYEHSYPHCWRTDKPILYYPLDSWFIRTTAYKERMVELNKTINWKPESTGTGRFGNWLENLVDWNLSRSRYWGTPLPIWRTEDGEESICIGSMEELRVQMEKARAAGISNPAEITDLHRPQVDEIVLVSPSGKPMYRETDLIDVWFDSGAMPYAQWHYPFENRDLIESGKAFPADFIAEGVDQTRGWFFTLHALAVMLFDSVAFKTVVSNGLVLDKEGNKMSKRLGNAIDPFKTLDQYGADATRWYIVSNSQPWDNLKFDLEGVKEVQRKFFGTLYNTYGFFALYANIDAFRYEQAEVPMAERPEIDRWVISLLNSLISEVEEAYASYEPTRAARAIQEFVDEHLSNWYVRLCRRRFWRGELNTDKLAAYQTLYRCLEVISQLMAPVAPFYAERLFRDLNQTTGRLSADSVHLALFPKADLQLIDKALESRMQLAQEVCSMVLSLRKKENIKVRQPLQKIMIPVLEPEQQAQIAAVAELIQTEVNVKEIEFLTDTTGVITKKVKPNFKTLGPKYPKQMKGIAVVLASFNQAQIADLERNNGVELDVEGTLCTLSREDVDILSEDIPGWLVASAGKLTVALDITVTEELKNEGIARELVNRIQKLRKDSDFEVTDRISVWLEDDEFVKAAVRDFKAYICGEILATDLELVRTFDVEPQEIEVDERTLRIVVKR